MSSIVIFNFIAFVYIAVAYAVIYHASSHPNVRKSVRKRSRQWRRDNRKMQKKVMLLVATDMACWLPICCIFMLRICGVEVHDVVHGITGTVLLPINSAMNPIIYSTTLYKIRYLCRKKKQAYYENSIDVSENGRYSVDLIYGRQNAVSTDLTVSFESNNKGNLDCTGRKPGARFAFDTDNKINKVSITETENNFLVRANQQLSTKVKSQTICQSPNVVKSYTGTVLNGNQNSFSSMKESIL
uniref:G-protein coupled receptors family 1 profile domain-containing protein n=1 Tax=Ciona savignyi TaxID=51511 RepID=H2ZCK5_CIOSA